jgi:DNA-binding Lrp family transcriptional regulator
MTLRGLDDLDHRILHALQHDARHTSSNEIAEEMDVSPSTVRKRIERLESNGIVTGYHADIDYERAGYQLQVQISCTAPITKREELGEQALDVPGVVSVREIAAGENNLLVRVVAQDNDDLTRIATELSERGLAISNEQLIRGEYAAPDRIFGTENDSEADD